MTAARTGHGGSSTRGAGGSHSRSRTSGRRIAARTAARNTGLDRATAPLIAFFDSDDLWLAHHLERCVAGFDEAPEVDWIFAACEMVDSAGQLVHDSTFLDRSRRPHEFLFLEHDIRGELRVINDPHAIECLLDSGIYCGLQNSVLRAELFARERFWEDYRVVEDSQFLLRGLVHGIRLPYLTDVHVVYRMHEENSSGSALGVDRRQLRRISEEKIRGLERLKAQLSLTPRQRRAMDRNLAREFFWRLGYACCWQGETSFSCPPGHANGTSADADEPVDGEDVRRLRHEGQARSFPCRGLLTAAGSPSWADSNCAGPSIFTVSCGGHCTGRLSAGDSIISSIASGEQPSTSIRIRFCAPAQNTSRNSTKTASCSSTPAARPAAGRTVYRDRGW